MTGLPQEQPAQPLVQEMNTNTIVAAIGAGSYAAKVCYDLVYGGYNDWYLPSMDELTKLYENRSILGGLSSYIYWSSSDDPSNEELHLSTTFSFMNRVAFISGSMKVCAIRSF
ncbi:MAG: hypothetical protein R2757_21385 [Draconibacterium sp.]